MSDDEIVSALCAVESGLTGWEIDFVESLAARIEGRLRLTDGQREKAEEILQRIEGARRG